MMKVVEQPRMKPGDLNVGIPKGAGGRVIWRGKDGKWKIRIFLYLYYRIKDMEIVHPHIRKRSPNNLKILLTVVLVSTCFFSLHAREPVIRNALSISAGPSIPFSEFANRSFTYRAGFAKAGANLDLDIIRYGRRGIFGIYAELGLANIFFDKKSYIAEYERILNNEGTTTATTGGYQFLTVHGGFLLRFAEFLDTRIILQAGIGYSLARHPYLAVTNSYWGEINRVNSDLDLQIGSSASIKVERSLNEETGIHLSYSLFACKPDFRDTESFREYTFYLPVRYQSINIGLTRYF